MMSIHKCGIKAAVIMVAVFSALLSGCHGTPAVSSGGNQTETPVQTEDTVGAVGTTGADSALVPESQNGSESQNESGQDMDHAVTGSLPKITADSRMLLDAGVSFPMEYGADGDVVFFADVDHDGKQERILAGLTEMEKNNGQYSRVRVLADEAEDSPVLWERDYGMAHVGWNMLYLCQEDGMDYLMEYRPYMNQGYADYHLNIFSLDQQGNENSIHSFETDFALQRSDEMGVRTGFYGDTGALVEFLETAEKYVNNSLLIVSTQEGILAYSTPGQKVYINRNDPYVANEWNITGEVDEIAVLRQMKDKNWAETEGIPNLREFRASDYEVSVYQKNRNRFDTTADQAADQLFADMSGRNWTFLPEQKAPEGNPDVVMTIYRKYGDLNVSCYLEEELAVVWTPPFVYDIENNMRSINESYVLSADVIGRLLEWQP